MGTVLTRVYKKTQETEPRPSLSRIGLSRRLSPCPVTFTVNDLLPSHGEGTTKFGMHLPLHEIHAEHDRQLVEHAKTHARDHTVREGCLFAASIVFAKVNDNPKQRRYRKGHQQQGKHICRKNGLETQGKAWMDG